VDDWNGQESNSVAGRKHQVVLDARICHIQPKFVQLDELFTSAEALYVGWYNFCRVHQTLRITLAAEASFTDHIWSAVELLTFGRLKEKEAA